MKKGLRFFLLTLLMTVMAVAMLCGCGPKKPAPEDAQAYVKAVLDLISTGDYDHSVKIADIEEGKEAELRDDVVDSMMEKLGSEANLNEEVMNSFKDFMIHALEKTKYTVGEATAAEDGGYDVTVSVEPLQIFTGIQDELNSVLEERVAAEADTIMAMSEDEQTNYVMEILIELLNKKLEDPKYDPAEEVTVHYGLLEEDGNVYGCTAEEGEKVGAKLFSQSGM